MVFRPGWLHAGEPLARDFLKGIRAVPGMPRGLALGVWVHSLGQQLAGIVALLARRPQAHLRVRAQGKAVFLAVEPVLEPPRFAARGRDFKVEAATVEDLLRLAAFKSTDL